MTGQPDETRSDEAIRADLAMEKPVSHCNCARPGCASCFHHSAEHRAWRKVQDRLAADVPALLADRARLQKERDAALDHLSERTARLWVVEDEAAAARAEVTRLQQAVEEVLAAPRLPLGSVNIPAPGLARLTAALGGEQSSLIEIGPWRSTCTCIPGGDVHERGTYETCRPMSDHERRAALGGVPEDEPATETKP